MSSDVLNVLFVVMVIMTVVAFIIKNGARVILMA